MMCITKGSISSPSNTLLCLTFASFNFVTLKPYNRLKIGFTTFLAVLLAILRRSVLEGPDLR
jgi:hypothetical protein